MQPSTDDLKAAFKRTGLRFIGYSYQKTIECEMLRKCLVRMAQNANKHVSKPQQLTLLEPAQ
jgi:hypothetical protein